jgi:hypothetical protein
MHGSADITIPQNQTVIPMLAGRLIGKSSTVQSRKKKISTAITGEDSAGAIGPMCTRS